MGQCCSSAPRPGRNAQFKTSSTEGRSTSATSLSTRFSAARRSIRRPAQRSSNAIEECKAEAASGLLSLSDFSKASGILASPVDGTPTVNEHQTFGKLIAQEAKDDAMRKSTEDRRMSPKTISPVPSSKASGDGHRRDTTSDRKRGEITEAPSVADLMNIKARRSLERLRLLSPDDPPDDPRNLKKSRSKNERGTGSHNSSSLRSTESSKQSLPGPVDFDFLVQKAAVDQSTKTSQACRDGELSSTDPNGTDSARTSPLSGKDMDDFSRSYKESAARAAARDRDAFKYISSSENDLSISSSVGASPGSARPRRKRHSRNASSYSVPDVGEKESPSPTGMPMKDIAESYQRKFGSPPLPKAVGLIRNKSSPSIPRGTLPVEAKPAGLTRNRSSPGSLHQAGLTAAQAQEQARQKYAHAQFVARAGKLPSSRSSTQSRRVASTIPDR